MEQIYDLLYEYLTNLNTKTKKEVFLEYMKKINEYNLNMNNIKYIFEKYIKKRIFYYQEKYLYYEFIRKIIFNNFEEILVKEFINKNKKILFIQEVLKYDDYQLFKEEILEYMKFNIKHDEIYFNKFEDYIDFHYKKNNIKDNNNILINIIKFNNCLHQIEYIKILNKNHIYYTIDVFMNEELKNSIIDDLKKCNNYDVFEYIIEKLDFYDVNKLSLTKVLKYNGFSHFTIILLYNCIKKYKIINFDYYVIFTLLDEYILNNNIINDNHDLYISKYFELCINNKYIKADEKILNLCLKYKLKKLFNKLLTVYNIIPNDSVINNIINNINSNECDTLNTLINMKYIITKDNIKKILENGLLNNKLKEILISNNFIELNDDIFEDYIKYNNNKNDDKFTLLDFKLNYTINYFDIIHKYNTSNNYNIYLEFLIKKCNMNKKEIKHILEFTHSKYNKDNYKDSIDNYIKKSNYKINKYCLDMCMKVGNYNAGIYLIEKYDIKPDILTMTFIKNLSDRINFNYIKNKL